MRLCRNRAGARRLWVAISHLQHPRTMQRVHAVLHLNQLGVLAQPRPTDIVKLSVRIKALKKFAEKANELRLRLDFW